MKNHNNNNIEKKSDDNQSEEITETKNIHTDENSEDKNQSDEEKETNIKETDKTGDKNGKSNDKSAKNGDDDNNYGKNNDKSGNNGDDDNNNGKNNDKPGNNADNDNNNGKNNDKSGYNADDDNNNEKNNDKSGNNADDDNNNGKNNDKSGYNADDDNNNGKNNDKSGNNGDDYNNNGKKEKNLDLKVFISYSREHDKIVAGLISHVLTCQGFKTLFDRRLYSGANIADHICKLISQSHAVVMILSQKSIDSPWINQELGYALALNKPIIQIPIERPIKPCGMFEGLNVFDYDTDWFNDENSIKQLTNHIHEAIEEKDTSPSIIKTREERTIEITSYFNNLNELLQKDINKNVLLKLYKRTSISIFSVKGHLKEGSQRYNDYYWELLRKQRKSIEKLIDNNENVHVRLHLDVERREYKDNIELERLNDLIKYIEKVNKNKKLRKRFKFKNEKHGQTNIIALNKHIIFEGLRPKPMDEYLYTLRWDYPSKKFNDFFQNFDDECWKDSENILKELKLYQKIKHLKLILKRNNKDYNKNNKNPLKNELDFLKRLEKEVEDKEFEKYYWENEIEKKLKLIEDNDSLHEDAINTLEKLVQKFEKKYKEIKEKICSVDIVNLNS